MDIHAPSDSPSRPTARWNLTCLDDESHLILPFLDSFTATLQHDNTVSSNGQTAGASLPIKHVASFFDFLCQSNAPERVLDHVGRCFERHVLSTTDIHSLALGQEPDYRSHLIKSYLRIAGRPRKVPRSALLESSQKGTVRMTAVFGGQGTHNGDGLNELRRLYDTYKPLLSDLIEHADSVLKQIVKYIRLDDPLFDYAVDLIHWLESPDTAPNRRHIATAPISFPINGIISLAHYCITCHFLRKHPGQMIENLTGATGHSQGVVVAAAIASSGSWEDFDKAAENAIALLYWIGLKGHFGTPSFHFPGVVPQSPEWGQEALSSMLSVQGLSRHDMIILLDEFNAQLDPTERVYLALVNSYDKMVIAGPTRTLQGVSALLQEKQAPKDLDQAKIPFPDRLPVIDYQLLPISAAFHSPHLELAAQQVLAQLERDSMPTFDLKIPLFDTHTGQDLRRIPQNELLVCLVRMIMCETLEWHNTCFHRDSTHILDFGPGHTSKLLQQCTKGSGIRIVHASTLLESEEAYGGMQEIFSPDKLHVTPDWYKLHGPKIVKDADGNIGLSTRMSRLLGVPPVMVAGMTPTTIHWDFVASVMNAGYHIELAGGGYSQAHDFEAAIRKLAASIPSHRGITCNIIYANPKAVAWQIPLIRTLRLDGIQIEGLTIGAGVPSADVAKDYIETLGLKHISFKPGSVKGVHQVLDIAERNPLFPIGLQWTGGRAGGHHSYEDFHSPILETYAQIRNHPNVILIVGSGFGDAHGMMPYLTGSWSQSLGHPRMPVDGTLLGSRMMTAKEAHTSRPVKTLIVQTPGTSEADWHGTYGGSAGGVITVRSEMGEPIHKLANRAVLLWKDLDTTIFSLRDPAKRLEALSDRREQIISRLNSDYAKPWFAVDSDGRNVEIEDMTYAECAQRLIDLMYLPQQRRWVDKSYQSMFQDLIHRFRERFNESPEPSSERSNEPFNVVYNFLCRYPQARNEILYPDDVSFFIGLCKRHGQKPVNFIPRLDEYFETWFKKDSLWQMEDLDAVIDRDPQRVCIIHGPVAARHSTKIDESAATILNDIASDLTGSLLLNLPIEETLANTAPMPMPGVLFNIHNFVEIEEMPMQVKYRFKSSISQENSDLLLSEIFAENEYWPRSFLMYEHISRGDKRFSNPIRTAFAPSVGDVLTLKHHSEKKQIASVVLSRKALGRDELYPALAIRSADGKAIYVTLQAPFPIGTEVSFKFSFKRKSPHNDLEELTEDRESKIKTFYASCWAIVDTNPTKTKPGYEFAGQSMTLTRNMVDRFMAVASKGQGDATFRPCSGSSAPLDLGIVVAWSALTKPLLLPELGGDLFRLLHRSIGFEQSPGAQPLQIGEALETSACITSIKIQPQGKLIEIVARVRREKEIVMKITSSFFLQGQFSSDEHSFRFVEEPEIKVKVNSVKLQGLLGTRKWLTIDDDITVGKVLSFKLTSKMTYTKSSEFYQLDVDGPVFVVEVGHEVRLVGHVSFHSAHCTGNPVMNFLHRHGVPARPTNRLKLPGWKLSQMRRISMLDLGREYSDVSGDYNPIHVCPVLAGFARLPGPITHGMYTSAIVRNFIEREIAITNISQFRRWNASFEGMVRAGHTLRMEMQHTSMVDGIMTFEVQVYNDETNEKVLTAEADFEQAHTAYLFCGQGSQEKGMGSAQYETDEAVKEVWDRGDRHLFDLYGILLICFPEFESFKLIVPAGISLLDIVRNNPKTKTVHFGGSKGRKIRSNYLRLTRKATRDGREVSIPVMDGLTYDSESYTFQEPRGLLFSTQFAQPAITLMNLAETASLQSRGLMQQDAYFAGHSLGEYSALAACADFMPLEALLGLVFYRGTVMQFAMEKDSSGQTEFSMVAVNPSRVGRGT